MDNIYVKRNNIHTMKNIIKEVELLNKLVRIITKSNKVIEYNFDTHRVAVQYFNTINNN